jgi:hypothetical protein
MAQDRTTPMRQSPQPGRGEDRDEQETVYTSQESVTPPTIPVGDPGGWGRSSAPEFAPVTPYEGAVPQSYQQPVAPYGAPNYQTPGAVPAQTVIISERPTPVFAWLVIVDGPAKSEVGKVHALHPDATTIGRVPGNHVILRDETCSAQHARIRIEARDKEPPAFVLYDMGSRNGTYIGDRESYKNEENRSYRRQLEDGDYLLLGETTLVFKKL